MEFCMKLDLQCVSIIKRPSSTCKTPYVADICINNETKLAHAPALGCCGLSDKDKTVMVSKLNNQKTKCDYRIELATFYEREKK